MKDGEYVTCSACQKSVVVKVFAKKQISLMGPDAIRSFQKQNIAVQCQDCGRFLCFSCCTSSITGTVTIPRCPECGMEGGPYFIVGEKGKRWWEFWK